MADDQQDTAHRVVPTDEGCHPPGTEPLWGESYYLDFVTDDGSLGGYARVGLYPNLGVTWWTTWVVGPDRPGVASVAYDLPLPEGDGAGARGVTLRSGPTSLACTADDRLRTMSVTAEAPATVHPDPAAILRGEPGEPTTLGLDLRWTTDGTPYQYDVTTRYEIPCLVEGEVAVGGERLAVQGQGQRDHSWGVRDWWAFGWCWFAARLDDGTRLHFADIRIPGLPVALGYVQAPGEPVATVASVTVDDGPEAQLPSRATVDVEPGGYRLEVTPTGFGPVLLTATDGRTSQFPRAMVEVAADDGRRGRGWIEWNRPDPG